MIELGNDVPKQHKPVELSHKDKEAPIVMSDIEGYVSQVDGTWIKSRSHHREHLKQHRMIELGNDVPTQHKPVELSRKDQETRKRKIAELAYAKLNYR